MAEVALSTISVLICIPIAILAVELLSALGRRPMRQTMNSFDAPKRIAVIVPAHNEEDNILPTLIDVKRQIHEFGRLLVVADNCDDNTAKVARAAGAEVCERFDPQRRGKGYALDWGLRYLRHDPPEAVVIIDADCRVGEGAIVLLASAALASGRPAQAFMA